MMQLSLRSGTAPLGGGVCVGGGGGGGNFVQFSPGWYLRARKSPYALLPVSPTLVQFQCSPD